MKYTIFGIIIMLSLQAFATGDNNNSSHSSKVINKSFYQEIIHEKNVINKLSSSLELSC